MEEKDERWAAERKLGFCISWKTKIKMTVYKCTDIQTVYTLPDKIKTTVCHIPQACSNTGIHSALFL